MEGVSLVYGGKRERERLCGRNGGTGPQLPLSLESGTIERIWTGKCENRVPLVIALAGLINDQCASMCMHVGLADEFYQNFLFSFSNLSKHFIFTHSHRQQGSHIK